MAQINGPFHGLYIQNGRYKQEFEEIEKPIGKGGYGIVFKAKNKIDDKDYAIKKIIISSNEDYNKKIRELKIWAKLVCDCFVQYRSSWVEIYNAEEIQKLKVCIQELDNSTVIPGNGDNCAEVTEYAILYIQMDLCSFTLSHVMNEINKYFKISKGKMLPKIAYFIASELFIEILEGISYLHKQKIIHRDLKPNNILINNGMNNKFIKIADFGISTLHESEDQSHTQMTGTLKYMAPEVIKSRKYDFKSDIFSIGVITQEMFNVDINKFDESILNDPLLMDKYKNLNNLINNCMSVAKKSRPYCDEILKDKNLWAIDFNDVSFEVENSFEPGVVYDIEENFVLSFLQSKLKS